jgi:WD40 repeat protein
LWNPARQELKTLKGDSSLVRGVAFSPDGKTVPYTMNSSDLNLDDLMARGCAWVRDYLQNNPNVDEKDKHLCDDIGTGR